VPPLSTGSSIRRVAGLGALIALGCGPRSGGAGVGAAPIEGTSAEVEDGAAAAPVGSAPAEATFLDATERGIAVALDGLRREPPGFAARLRAHRARFAGTVVTVPGEELPLQTVEGVAAVDEAIAAVRRSGARSPVVVSPVLSAVAREHARVIGALGTLDHESRDGSPPHVRMDRVGSVEGQSGENIATGYRDGEMMLLSLVVDDGVPDRGHRLNLLEPAFRVVGIGCAPHRLFRTVCVVDLAAGFVPD
jgi:uncharacterized protein YkwD